MFICNSFDIKSFNQPIQNRPAGYHACPISFGTNRLEKSPLNGDETVFFGQKPEPEVIYGNRNLIDKIIFPKPTSLKEVSEFLINPKIRRDFACFSILEIKAIGESKFADTKITKLLGNGDSASAFLMEDGNVLKISNEEHFNRRHEDFDVPVYDNGILANKYCNNLYYYVEQYANPEGVSEDEIKAIVKRIKAKGYKVFDIHPRQFGKTAEGEVYLIDPECAYK